MVLSVEQEESILVEIIRYCMRCRRRETPGLWCLPCMAVVTVQVAAVGILVLLVLTALSYCGRI